MTKYTPVHGPARLRQRGGDRILHVTDNGTTYSGHVYNTSWTMTSGEFPTMELELSNGWPDPLGEVDVTRLSLAANRILAADVDALDLERLGSPAFAQVLGDMRQWFIPGDLPPCEHEEVIDTTSLDDALAQGMCVWCGHRMVAEQRLEITRGPWKPLGG